MQAASMEYMQMENVIDGHPPPSQWPSSLQSTPIPSSSPEPTNTYLNTEASPSGNQIPTLTKEYDELIIKARDKETVRIIVGLNIPWQPEGNLPNPEAVTTQQKSITIAQDKLIQELSSYNAKLLGKSKYTPYMYFELNETALRFLTSLPNIKSIKEDIPGAPL